MEAVGLLQRIGAVLRVVKLTMTDACVAWEEVKRPEQDAVSSIAPTVSIAAGSVVLDLSSLSRGAT